MDLPSTNESAVKADSEVSEGLNCLCRATGAQFSMPSLDKNAASAMALFLVLNVYFGSIVTGLGAGPQGGGYGGPLGGMWAST